MRVLHVVDAVKDLPNGATALVGSGSAVQEDFNRASERDLRVIVPVALLVITLLVYWLAEQYAHILGHALAGHRPARGAVVQGLRDGWPMVRASSPSIARW